MNIFYLDHSPIIAARYMVDAHAKDGKMLVEACQMLANCYTPEQLATAPLTQKGTVRKHSYFNHPCSIWARASYYNFRWLLEHAAELQVERYRRTGKDHFAHDFVRWVIMNEPTFPSISGTFPALAMPEKYHSSDPVESYRRYYTGEKRHLAAWTNREPPEWWA